MKSWLWLRTLAGVLAFFTIGHTLGTAAPRPIRGAGEAAVYAAMQEFRFPVMGFSRTHWDFYRGFALTVSVLLLMMTVITWQVAGLDRHAPRHALPMAMVLLPACAGLLVLGWMFFFGAPIVTSATAVFLASAAAMRLMRETRSADRER